MSRSTKRFRTVFFSSLLLGGGIGYIIGGLGAVGAGALLGVVGVFGLLTAVYVLPRP